MVKNKTVTKEYYETLEEVNEARNENKKIRNCKYFNKGHCKYKHLETVCDHHLNVTLVIDTENNARYRQIDATLYYTTYIWHHYH